MPTGVLAKPEREVKLCLKQSNERVQFLLLIQCEGGEMVDAGVQKTLFDYVDIYMVTKIETPTVRCAGSTPAPRT